MITTYRYGEPRTGSTLRLGAARQAPRGVRRQDYRMKNYFDLWLRVLGPSQALLKRYREGVITFREFATAYRSEMSQVEPRQVIDVVAVLSRSRPIAIGCYCEREDHCHRSILKQLIQSAAAALPPGLDCGRRANASPVCFAEEEDL
jgi:uncharacterized protein YeaO (DUF488 family)